MSMADPSAEAALSSSPTANPTWDNFYFQHTATNHLETHLVLRQLSLEIRSYCAVLEIHAAESLLLTHSNHFWKLKYFKSCYIHIALVNTSLFLVNSIPKLCS